MKGKSRTRTLCLTLCVTILQVVLYGCMADTKHLVFASVNHSGWAHTDTLTYTITPLLKNNATTPNGCKSGISLLLHTQAYKYNNIALDITIRQDTCLLYHELRNYQLDNCQAKGGIGLRCDYTLPVDNITLCDTLPTTITLTQQLDQPLLLGIHKVGILIGAPTRKPGEPIWRVDW